MATFDIENYEEPVEGIVVDSYPIPIEELNGTHALVDNAYVREVFLPKGAYAVGKEHKRDHFNNLLKGQVVVMMDDDVHLVTAPATFVAKAGSRKFVVALEDSIFQNLHAIPEGIEPEMIENYLTEDTPIDPTQYIPGKDLVALCLEYSEEGEE